MLSKVSSVFLAKYRPHGKLAMKNCKWMWQYFYSYAASERISIFLHIHTLGPIFRKTTLTEVLDGCDAILIVRARAFYVLAKRAERADQLEQLRIECERPTDFLCSVDFSVVNL